MRDEHAAVEERPARMMGAVRVGTDDQHGLQASAVPAPKEST
jgi:hypothetical protein